MDNVGNRGNDVHPEGVTTELQETHDNLTHISVALGESAGMDPAGLPVYTTLTDATEPEQGDNAENPAEPKSEPLPIDISLMDDFNGIASFGYVVKVNGQPFEEHYFKVEQGREGYVLSETPEIYIPNLNDAVKGGHEDDAAGEAKTAFVLDESGIESGEGLVTKITGKIYVDLNVNDISVDITMYDNSGNISYTSANKEKANEPETLKFHIDNTLPKIEFAHIANDKTVGKKNEEDKPSAYSALEAIGSTPFFITHNISDFARLEGFDVPEEPAENPDAEAPKAEYPIYDTSTLRIKITERNLTLEALKEMVENSGMSRVVKLTETKNAPTKAEHIKVENLSDEVRIFGPYRETTDEDGRKDTVEVDADGTRLDGDFYILELRNCTEVEAGGTYEADLHITDMAGHEEKGSEYFVIDTIAPVITISFDNNDAENGNYYKAQRRASIVVVERNHNIDTAAFTGRASLDGAEREFPGIAGWSAPVGKIFNNNVDFNADGFYQDIVMAVNDLAGHTSSMNVASFHIDTVIPEIEIANVEDKTAYNGTITPALTYSDINLDEGSVTITLTGVANGVVDYQHTVTEIHNGFTRLYNDFDKRKEVDDVYTLFIHLKDLAGNENTQTLRFSCNRFGSFYDLTKIKDLLNRFNKEARDLIITETNVDPVDLENLRLTLTKDGTPSDLVMGEDFTIEPIGEEGTWHQYIYTIAEELFEENGTYSLYFRTLDAAGNINENIDESKDALVNFGIDKTTPIITPIDLEPNTQYPVENKQVAIEIKDNLDLESVHIYLNDEEVGYIIDGDSYIFDIPMSNSKQSLHIVARDSAGNELTLDVNDFLVTTNLFARWFNNTPLFIGSMVVLVAAIALGAWRFFIILGRRKEEEEENV